MGANNNISKGYYPGAAKIAKNIAIKMIKEKYKEYNKILPNIDNIINNYVNKYTNIINNIKNNNQSLPKNNKNSNNLSIQIKYYNVYLKIYSDRKRELDNYKEEMDRMLLKLKEDKTFTNVVNTKTNQTGGGNNYTKINYTEVDKLLDKSPFFKIIIYLEILKNIIEIIEEKNNKNINKNTLNNL